MDLNKKKFYDPAIDRKSKIVNERMRYIDGIPLPSVIEISESGTCNRKCSFCPRSDKNYPDVKEFISTNLLDKLISDLAAVDYKGLILFSGFVEPMIDVNIYSHIEKIRKCLPLVKIDMVTNGDVLNASRISKLKDSGLSTLLISVYDGEESAMEFNQMCIDAGLQEDEYVIRHRYLPADQTFGITINNRSGMMVNAEYSIPPLSAPLSDPCFYPHYTFFMDYLGDVLICPHDWGKKKVVGNIMNNTFLEIWNSAEFNVVRRLLADGKRNFSPCRTCDVNGTLIGNEHAEAWSKLVK